MPNLQESEQATDCSPERLGETLVQRRVLMHRADVSASEVARFRRPVNRLSFAVQLRAAKAAGAAPVPGDDPDQLPLP